MPISAAKRPAASIFGRSAEALKPALAGGGTVTVLFPTAAGMAIVSLEGPTRAEDPGGCPTILPREGGTPYRVVIGTQVDGETTQGWKFSRRVFEIEPGKSPPPIATWIAILGETSDDVLAQLKRLYRLLPPLLKPLAGRKGRALPPLVVRTAGEPDPVLWLGALSDADLSRALLAASR